MIWRYFSRDGDICIAVECEKSRIKKQGLMRASDFCILFPPLREKVQIA